ncbi:MAG: hypothetical protein NTX01_07855 [Candidatus Omnitrophica bacterium]|nr:hypothetical protein [Candidatus Omnitrophota bacterium]
MVKQGAVIDVNDPARFEKLPDGWIRDYKEGKEHGPSSDKILGPGDRKEFCAKLGGEEPTVAEAASIINFEGDPCFFPIFADTKTDGWYATKSEPAWGKSDARIVDYDRGDVYYYNKGNEYYVRPVRPSSVI